MLKASEQIPKDKTMPKIYQISNPQTLTYFIPVWLTNLKKKVLGWQGELEVPPQVTSNKGCSEVKGM